LRDAVVELTRDAAPLGLRAERVQPPEPARVVERQREHARQRVEQISVVGTVGLGRLVLDRNGADERTPGS